MAKFLQLVAETPYGSQYIPDHIVRAASNFCAALGDDEIMNIEAQVCFFLLSQFSFVWLGISNQPLLVVGVYELFVPFVGEK